jgi:hypothetical protein
VTSAYTDVVNEVIMDETGDAIYVPERIAPTRPHLLRVIVEFYRSILGRGWRWEVGMRPFVEPERIFMRHMSEIEDGWYGGCDETDAGAEPFWKVV